MLPGAVLTRVASSHIRVGTFEYALLQGDPALVRRLADYTIARHFPGAAQAENPYLELLDRAVGAQAALVAQWMLVGFIHGVMNTDNMAISGETLDYGPCAFMDSYDPATVFSSIDHGGRYAYANQPAIAHWNLARLAETLLGLLSDDMENSVAVATSVLGSFRERYGDIWLAGMRAKLGLSASYPEDETLIADLLSLLHDQGVDFTLFFRALGRAMLGDDAPLLSKFSEPSPFEAWRERWDARVALETADPRAAAVAMDRVNPAYIPRNHRVEEALAAATGGNMEPFDRLVEVVREPFEERAGLDHYAAPAPSSLGEYRTFCGT